MTAAARMTADLCAAKRSLHEAGRLTPEIEDLMDRVHGYTLSLLEGVKLSDGFRDQAMAALEELASLTRSPS